MCRLGIVAIALWFGVATAQELTVWTHLRGEAWQWLEQEVNSFSQNFKIPVVLEHRDISDIKQHMLQNPSQAADIIVPIAHDQIEEMLEQNLLLDFKALSTSSYLEGYAPQTRLAFQRNQQLFALPLYVEGAALIVNTSLVADVPDDFAGFIERAQALTTGETAGFLYDIGNFYFSYLWLRSAGAYVFARDKQGNLQADAIGLASPAAVAGARRIQALRYTYDLIPKGTDYSVADNRFREGKLAMIYNGPWALAAYQQAGIAMRVLPMPTPKRANDEDMDTEENIGTEHTDAGDTDTAGFMGVYGVVINQQSNHALEAVDFAKWLARESSQTHLAQQAGYIPARLAAAEASGDSLIAEFAQALRHAEPMPHIAAMGNVWAPMSDALSLILDDDDADIAGLLEQAVQEIKQ